MMLNSFIGKGSSPRMRGAPVCRSRMRRGGGIIPADAGSTELKRQIGALKEDHPRGCGQH